MSDHGDKEDTSATEHKQHIAPDESDRDNVRYSLPSCYTFVVTRAQDRPLDSTY